MDKKTKCRIFAYEKKQKVIETADNITKSQTITRSRTKRQTTTQYEKNSSFH